MLRCGSTAVNTPLELLNTWRSYNINDIVQNIKCPTLIADAENEPLSSGQAKLLYKSLTCRKDYILFLDKEGAGEHCEAGAKSLFHQRAFDWLEEAFLHK